MKSLKIENFQGLFRTEEGVYETVDKIDKEALLNLLSMALEDDFDLDEYDEDKLRNQAHQVIYKSIAEKLEDLHERRNQFRDEADRMFLEAYEKYRG